MLAAFTGCLVAGRTEIFHRAGRGGMVDFLLRSVKAAAGGGGEAEKEGAKQGKRFHGFTFYDSEPCLPVIP